MQKMFLIVFYNSVVCSGVSRRNSFLHFVLSVYFVDIFSTKNGESMEAVEGQ